MTRIGLLSDTHGNLDTKVLQHFTDCDQIWHAGDFGSLEVASQLADFKPLRGVYGNIDGAEIRRTYPLEQIFVCENFQVWMIHIGGYPPHYNKGIKKRLGELKADLFICGHSHILKVIRDPENGVLALNPGAAGFHGFHHVRTLMKFELHQKKIEKMQVIELGARTRINA